MKFLKFGRPTIMGLEKVYWSLKIELEQKKLLRSYA